MMFKTFLEEPEVYAAAVAYWSVELSALGWRQAWLNTAYADGTPMRDGNPIFSAIHAEWGRAVRIIQECGDGQEEVSGWISKAEGPNGSIDELVVCVVATEGTAAKTKAAVECWMGGGTSREALSCL